MSTAPAQAQATRTWVSGVGDDVNPCSRTAPCKTFAGAISKTAAGGEINCLDPAGFGTVTITKSMTIDCEGTLGSILASSTNGVNVNDSATGTPGTIEVRLRNLSINGAGTGLIGVNATSLRSLTLHNVTIANFNTGISALGIKFSPAASAQLLVSDSAVENNGTTAGGGGGIQISPTAGATAFVQLNRLRLGFNATNMALLSTTGAVQANMRDSTSASGRNNGILAIGGGFLNNFLIERSSLVNNFGTAIGVSGANATTRLGDNTIQGNGTGVSASGGGAVLSFKNNQIAANGTDSSPALPLNPVPGGPLN